MMNPAYPGAASPNLLQLLLAHMGGQNPAPGPNPYGPPMPPTMSHGPSSSAGPNGYPSPTAAPGPSGVVGGGPASGIGPGQPVNPAYGPNGSPNPPSHVIHGFGPAGAVTGSPATAPQAHGDFLQMLHNASGGNAVTALLHALHGGGHNIALAQAAHASGHMTPQLAQLWLGRHPLAVRKGQIPSWVSAAMGDHNLGRQAFS